ncbi:preprotein translocase subunit SecA [Arachnia rubra]|jgi:preprotein translocase, secA subunit|uniref:Protein translocase subunit SecA n=1 Tax=Arachnia rubra TaxID=1547448 RepID=A0ABX7Y8U1_9ACTN|nr:preprotein translocase subunit SecA [Arachnia rubra]MBB1576814.1 preprotein translocase subunit SecA [Propionibacterium sp.]MDO4644396.1 preprotein translocase subunit SecA [Propionibacteriaceae bacterium]QUC09655.1 preprotein translocase subunit SecA [Arachnia rubra]
MDFLSNLGSGSQLRKLQKIADQVNLIEEDFQEMSDAELKEQTDTFKERLEDGEDLDSLMPEAFATVREASVRVLNKRHFDVQIMGGAALHWGNIAEMKTGEGKTLVGTLPSYLNALSGKGVHIVTTNDYLAKYQSEQMGRIHHFLGLEVGVILASMSPAERRVAYKCDITYGTNNEFGFDYLRDNMALSSEDLVQRGHHFAIVDEVDSILIDEARTPLIISGPSQDTHEWYPVFARLVRSMKRDQDYEVDEKKRTVAISGAGIEVVEDRLGIDNLYESANTPLISYLNNAIKAKELFKRDKDYVVLGDEILIVDEHTGRTLAGRRYNEGLHQALEAKEGVKIKDEYQTLATVTLQNYFRMYDKLAGMTGTAKTEESEFQKIYGLGVIPIPTNMPMIRIDQQDRIYRTEEAKYKAIIEDVVLRHEDRQPVLIGTASVAKSELLSGMLKKEGIPHEVLNAKQHEREAAVVAQAGRKGAVTVSTNMAGRGTDIMLGGNPEFLADLQLRKQGLDPVETPEEYEAQWPDTLKALEEQVEAEHDEVVEAGGLYVIGSERHESRRIDNQLRGRSGRQGDPGESRFYLSLSDDLMRLFRPEVLERALLMLKVPDDVPIDAKSVSNAIESAQKQVESQNFEMRKNVLKYDDVMNRQRHVIYRDRRRVLDGADLSEQLRDRAAEVVAAVVRQYTNGIPEDWDFDMLFNELRTLYPVGLNQEEIEDEIPGQDELVEMFSDDVSKAYDDREEALGADTMRELERQVVLSVVDRNWREHLYEMDYLREGIGLRAMAQRDPLVEYQREGGDMFVAMREASFEQIIGMLFNLQVTQPEPVSVGVVTDAEGKPEDVLGKVTALAEAETKPAEPAAPLAKGLGGKRQENLTYSAPDESGEATTSRNGSKKKPVNKAASSGGGNRAARRKAAKRKH